MLYDRGRERLVGVEYALMFFSLSGNRGPTAMLDSETQPIEKGRRTNLSIRSLISPSYGELRNACTSRMPGDGGAKQGRERWMVVEEMK